MREFRIKSADRLLNAALASVLLCAMITGCQKDGYDRVPVSGQVLIDGAPLTVGSVRFIPIGGGRPSFATIGAEGRFDFGQDGGVVVAKHRVEVNASEQLGHTGYRWHAPERYASSSSSGLEQVIERPTSDVVLNLTWDGGKPFTVKNTTGDYDPKNLKGRQ